MSEIILSETNDERKLFDVIGDDVILFREYKMNDTWHDLDEFALTKKELEIIFNTLRG